MLPVLVLLLLVVVQVGLVARDHVAVEHAAQAAARAAAITPADQVAADAAAQATTLRPDRLDVRLVGGRTTGEVLVVEVDYRSPTEVPVVGRFIADIGLAARAAALVE